MMSTRFSAMILFISIVFVSFLYISCGGTPPPPPQETTVEVRSAVPPVPDQTEEKKKEFEALIQKGDGEVASQAFDGALRSYTSAKDIATEIDDSALIQRAQDKIDSTQKMMEAFNLRKGKISAFNAAIKEGEGLFNSEEFPNAKSKFENAKKLALEIEDTDKDQLAQDWISKTDAAYTAWKADMNNKFNEQISEGDLMMRSGHYTDAGDKFGLAYDLAVKLGDELLMKLAKDRQALAEKKANTPRVYVAAQANAVGGSPRLYSKASNPPVVLHNAIRVRNWGIPTFTEPKVSTTSTNDNPEGLPKDGTKPGLNPDGTVNGSNTSTDGSSNGNNLNALNPNGGTKNDSTKTGAEKLLQEGIEFFIAKEYPKALESYTKAIGYDDVHEESDGGFTPDRRRDALYNLGLVEKKLGYSDIPSDTPMDSIAMNDHLKKAVEAFDECIKLSSEKDPFVKPYIQLSEIYHRSDELDQGVKKAKEGLDVDVNNLFLHFNLGVIYTKKSRQDVGVYNTEYINQALYHYDIVYKNAPQTFPNRFQMIFNMGWAKRHLGDFQAALNFYKEAETIQANDYDLKTQIGSTYFALDNVEQATKYLEEARAMNPNDIDASLILINIYYEQEKYSQTEKLLAEVEIKVNQAGKNYPEIYAKMGDVYYKLGKYNEAIVKYEKSVAAQPNNAKFIKHYSIALGATKQYANAYKQITKALQLDAKDPESLQHKGEMEIHLEKYDDAINTFSTLLKEHKTFKNSAEVQKKLTELKSMSR